MDALIASPCLESSNRWREAFDRPSNVFSAATLNRVRELATADEPKVMVVDLRLIEPPYAGALAELRRRHPHSRIIVLGQVDSDEAEIELLAAGACACCTPSSAAGDLQRVIAAVSRGELWVRRALIPRLINYLSGAARSPREIDGSTKPWDAVVAYLTRRELEIAQLVGQGMSNKRIGQHLAISDRTVKAHLTGIFRKLRVKDRLELALLVASQDSK
jgi:two-component system NarL family response regulator